MLAYVRGKTLVKGVRNKKVDYVGTVEEDGYVYFHDDMSYRCPTPATMNVQSQISLSNVQVWYTVRNCWIRANYFTELTCYCFDPADMYTRIQALENWRRDTVDPFITTITNWRNNTVDPFITNITNWRNNTVDPFITNITDWKNNTVDPVLAYLGDFWDELKWYDEDGTVHVVSTMKQWMQYHNTSDQLHKIQESALGLRITNLRNDFEDLSDDIGNISSFFSGTSFSNFTSWLRNKFSVDNSRFTAIENDITSINQTLSTMNTSLSNAWTQINLLWDALKDNNGNVIDINQLYEDTLQFYRDLIGIDQAIAAFDTLLNGIGGNPGMVDKLNELGHKALGGGNYSTHNGPVLLDTINKLNDVIGYVNAYHSVSIPYLNTSVWTNWTDFS